MFFELLAMAVYVSNGITQTRGEVRLSLTKIWSLRGNTWATSFPSWLQSQHLLVVVETVEKRAGQEMAVLGSPWDLVAAESAIVTISLEESLSSMIYRASERCVEGLEFRAGSWIKSSESCQGSSLALYVHLHSVEGEGILYLLT